MILMGMGKGKEGGGQIIKKMCFYEKLSVLIFNNL